jgi:hypothetical protein
MKREKKVERATQEQGINRDGKREKTGGKTKPSEWMKERNNEGRINAKRRRDLQSKQLRIQTKVQDTPN